MVTGSRSGLLLSAAAIALVPLLGIDAQMKVFRRGRAWVRWAIYASSAAGLATIVGATIFASRDVALSRLQAAEDDLRWPLWQSVIDATPHYMPWGTGIGSFVDAYHILEPEKLLRPDYSNHAHNEWLEIAFTAGLPGILLMIVCVAFFVAALLQARRAKGTGASFSRLGLALILVLAFASVTDYPIRTPIMMALLTLASVWTSSSAAFIETPVVKAEGKRCE